METETETTETETTDNVGKLERAFQCSWTGQALSNGSLHAFSEGAQFPQWLTFHTEGGKENANQQVLGGWLCMQSSFRNIQSLGTCEWLVADGYQIDGRFDEYAIADAMADAWFEAALKALPEGGNGKMLAKIGDNAARAAFIEAAKPASAVAKALVALAPLLGVNASDDKLTAKAVKGSPASGRLKNLAEAFATALGKKFGQSYL